MYMGNAHTYLERLLLDPTVSFLKPLLWAHLGRNLEVIESLEIMLRWRPKITSIEDETPSHFDIINLEAAVLVGHKKTAELILQLFSTNSLATTGYFYCTCIPHHLGGACALLGRFDEARTYYADAIKVCTEMRFRPELALSRLQLAELLLDHYPTEKKEAVEHLDFCIKEFREMKMQPSLERALRHNEILKA